jgi:hypothetical protein
MRDSFIKLKTGESLKVRVGNEYKNKTTMGHYTGKEILFILSGVN